MNESRTDLMGGCSFVQRRSDRTELPLHFDTLRTGNASETFVYTKSCIGIARVYRVGNESINEHHIDSVQCEQVLMNVEKYF